MVMKQAVERLYKDRCDVIEYQEIRKSNMSTGFEEVTVYADQRCRLSFSNISEATPGTAATTVQQIIKLFIAPDLAIQPGSKIIVTHEGRTTEYQCSGIPAIYPSHQEILLTVFERWA